MNNQRLDRRFAEVCSIAACSITVGTVLAKPPLQLADHGIRVEPIAIAHARLENGAIVLGEWQDYAPVQTPSAMGYYYTFDCFGGWVDTSLSIRGYVNRAHGGKGAEPGEPRVPWDTNCYLGSNRWYYGSTYVCPLTVEDIQTLAPGAQGGSPIDAIDTAWFWGGGECVLAYFTSDDPALCDDGDPLEHAYHEGLVINVGELEPGYYYMNSDGIWSQNAFFLPTPAPGGSYLAALVDPDGIINIEPGTQFMLWGTGRDNGEWFRAGTQDSDVWDDDYPTDGSLDENECYTQWGECPGTDGKCVGFLSRRCPADVNWDGFINADDYDLFAEWFDAGWRPDGRADLNSDGFVNADDYDIFAEWFEAGC